MRIAMPMLALLLLTPSGGDAQAPPASGRARRRLGTSEVRNAPVIASLGRRAGALVVAVVRHRDVALELVVFDVRWGAFYEGGIPLSETTSAERILGFVTRRAESSLRRGPERDEMICGRPVDLAVSIERPAGRAAIFTRREPEQQ